MLPPILLDQGLPWQVAAALTQLGLDVHAIGDENAPAEGIEDVVNIAWCAERGAILVTNDRGKKDRTILEHLNTHHVHAVFVYKDLRDADPHHLAVGRWQTAEPHGSGALRPRVVRVHRSRAAGLFIASG